MPDLQLRIAAPDDRAAILDLQRNSLKGLAARFYAPNETEAFLARAGRDLDQLLRQARVWVLARGELLVACGGWRLQDAQTAEVRSVYVRPEWTRRGLAGRLLDRIEEEARRAGAATVRLLAMRGSVEFYADRGFQPLGPGFVDADGLPFPGLEMAKPLRAAD